ncbi:hypothetical protein OF83DRAFT_1176568 [Amylostereum chailletii]|nr:hypothetical protein OF83DRAFT_1176568 [Amylostereum chailletii]
MHCLTQSGRVYTVIACALPFKTNLRFGALLRKAMAREDRVAGLREEAELQGRDPDEVDSVGSILPLTLSPASSSESLAASAPEDDEYDVSDDGCSPRPSDDVEASSRGLTPAHGALPTPHCSAPHTTPRPVGQSKKPSTQRKRDAAQKASSQAGSACRRRRRWQQESAGFLPPRAKYRANLSERDSATQAIHVLGFDAVRYRVTKGAYVARPLTDVMNGL